MGGVCSGTLGVSCCCNCFKVGNRDFFHIEFGSSIRDTSRVVYVHMFVHVEDGILEISFSVRLASIFFECWLELNCDFCGESHSAKRVNDALWLALARVEYLTRLLISNLFAN